MHNVDPHVLTLYETLDLIGVVLNGIIGGTIARQRDFDLVGFIFLALFSALGGGMLRDVLMDRGTAAAIANSNYLLLAVVGAILALLFHFEGKRWELFKVHADAVILGVWAVTGAVKALTFFNAADIGGATRCAYRCWRWDDPRRCHRPSAQHLRWRATLCGAGAGGCCHHGGVRAVRFDHPWHVACIHGRGRACHFGVLEALDFVPTFGSSENFNDAAPTQRPD